MRWYKYTQYLCIACLTVPSLILGQLYIPTESESPWINPIFEPDWHINASSIHGQGHKSSGHVVDVSFGSRLAIPSDIELTVDGALGRVRQKIQYPMLSFSIKKMFLNDIASATEIRSPIALSARIKGKFSSSSRVRQLIFQEFGKAQGDVSLLFGKHIFFTTKDYYAQIYGICGVNSASSGVVAKKYGISTAFYISNQSLTLNFLQSHGSRAIRGVLGQKRLELTPSFYETSASYQYLIPSFGIVSLVVSHRTFKKHIKFNSIQLIYTDYFSI